MRPEATAGTQNREPSSFGDQAQAARLRVGSRFIEGGGKVKAAEGIWGEEGSDLLDPRAVQGEHVDGEQHEGLCLVVPGVAAEGELPVRASGDEAPVARPRKWPAAEVDGDLFAAAVPGGCGRHRQLRVFGEHGNDRVDVVALPRGDVALRYESQRAVVQ